MALDPSIILSGKQFSPVESYSNAMTLSELAGKQRMQQMQAQQAQKQLDEDAAISQMYQARVGQDGKVDRQGLLSDLASKGLGNRIPGMQKQWADADKAVADVAHTQAQTNEVNLRSLKQKTDALNGAFASLLSNPNVTQDDVIGQLRGLVSQGWITPEEGAQTARELPGPNQLRQYIMQHALQSLDASKRLDALLPKVDLENLGDRTQAIDKNPLTNPTIVGQTFKRGASPDAQLSAATTRRGQDIQREMAGQGYSTQVDGQGNLIAIPNKVAPGQPITATTVVDQSGRPVAGKDGGLNDSQSKALLFGTRMQEADKILNDMASQGVKMPSMGQQTIGNVPIASWAANALATPKQQQVDQAQRDFINAVLRRESGAAISSGEFDSARKQYFPQPGDSPEVMNQKARNRQIAISGLMAEVPQGKRGSVQVPAASGGRPPLDSFKR